MALKRVLPSTNFNPDLVGNQTTNFDSRSLLTFGNFNLDSKFLQRDILDFSNFYANETVYNNNQLNFKFISDVIKFETDYSFLPKYVNYDSSVQFFRFSIEKMITNFCGSLYIDDFIESQRFFSILNLQYDANKNISQFQVPSILIKNNFGLVYSNNINNNSNFLNIEKHKNLITNFLDYEIMLMVENQTFGNIFEIIDFVGSGKENEGNLTIKVKGQIFSLGGNYAVKFHIKLKDEIIERINLQNLDGFQNYIFKKFDKPKNRYEFILQVPHLTEKNNFDYLNQILYWPCSDGYNIDFNGYSFGDFFKNLLDIGQIYDDHKSNYIIRKLIPESLFEFDLSENKTFQKLIYVYGSNFDYLVNTINDLTKVHTLSYNDNEKTSTRLLGNFMKMYGWDYFEFANEENFVKALFDEKTTYSQQKQIIPNEINLKLWERILINSAYISRNLGTRKIIEFMMRFVGLDESITVFNEFIYKIDKPISKIPKLTMIDVDFLEEVPIYPNGYPKKIKENKNLYFQRTEFGDFGNKYMEIYENVGYKLSKVIDNKKTWVYSENDENLRDKSEKCTKYTSNSNSIINTKQIEIGLDVAKKIEYGLYELNMSYKFADINFEDINFEFDLDSLENTTSDASYFEYCKKDCDDCCDEIEFNFAHIETTTENLTTTHSKFKEPYPIPNSILDVVHNRKISFCEYMDIMLSNYFEVSTRKITLEYFNLLNLYNQYIYYYQFDTCLQSSNYSVADMTKFLGYFNIRWFDFVKQAIPTTTIIVGGETIIRNTKMGREKYVYKKGIDNGVEFENDQKNDFEYGKKIEPISIKQNLINIFKKTMNSMIVNKDNTLLVTQEDLVAYLELEEDTQITIEWGDVFDGTGEFEIYMVNGEDLIYLDTVNGGITSYVATGLEMDTEYTFRVVWKKNLFEVESNDVVGQTTGIVVPPNLNQPINFIAQDISNAYVIMEFTDDSTSETGFEFVRCVGSFCEVLTTITSTSTLTIGEVYVFTDNDVAPVTNYEYKVRATDGVNFSPFTTLNVSTTA